MKPSEFKILEPFLLTLKENFFYVKNPPKSSTIYSIVKDNDGCPIFAKFEYLKKDSTEKFCLCKASYYTLMQSLCATRLLQY